jgi:hypothetical protein
VERLLRFSGYVFVALLAVTGLVMGLGSRLPMEHVATVTAEIAAAPERVWGLISDVERQPGWRTGLKAVEMTGPGAAGPCWREMQGWMAMPLCVTASEEPGNGRMGRRVVEVADPKLPFGGEWTYELEPVGIGATRVRITERGTTGPAMWRFFGHYVVGEDRNVRQYMRDLEGAVR